ncbi:hypothetical protein STEG23_010969, partial [Scotinomys teguina]
SYGDSNGGFHHTLDNCSMVQVALRCIESAYLPCTLWSCFSVLYKIKVYAQPFLGVLPISANQTLMSYTLKYQQFLLRLLKLSGTCGKPQEMRVEERNSFQEGFPCVYESCDFENHIELESKLEDLTGCFCVKTMKRPNSDERILIAVGGLEELLLEAALLSQQQATEI